MQLLLITSATIVSVLLLHRSKCLEPGSEALGSTFSFLAELFVCYGHVQGSPSSLVQSCNALYVMHYVFGVYWWT